MRHLDFVEIFQLRARLHLCIGFERTERARTDRRIPEAGRDGARTPMPWNGAWADPWLPQTAQVAPVSAQRDDPDSFLSYCRGLLAQRRANPDLVDGDYETLPAPDGVWAFRRGEHTSVAVNLSDQEAELDDGSRLEPWQGVVQRR